MRTIGIRELKEHAGEIVREVNETRQAVRITDRGQAVAMIVPLHRETSQAEREAAIRSLDSLAAEIGRHARQASDVAREISDMRR